MDTQNKNTGGQPLQRNKSQYFEGVLLVFLTVLRTARITARALMSEHPYALLFLLVFGIFLFPLSTTAIVGTLFLILTAGSTIFISVVFFAPALFCLTIIAFIVWGLSVLALCFYRYMWKPDVHQQTLGRQRSGRWELFRSTLERDTSGYQVLSGGILDRINTSTPTHSLAPTAPSAPSPQLRPLNLDSERLEDNSRRLRSFPVNLGIMVGQEAPALASSTPPPELEVFGSTPVLQEPGAEPDADDPFEASDFLPIERRLPNREPVLTVPVGEL